MDVSIFSYLPKQVTARLSHVDDCTFQMLQFAQVQLRSMNHVQLTHHQLVILLEVALEFQYFCVFGSHGNCPATLWIN